MLLMGHHGSGRWSLPDVALALLGPLLLVMVGVHQLALAAFGELTPWKGGGFGMFATADRPEHRVVRTSLVTADETVGVDVLSLIDDATSAERRAFLEVQALPDRARADSWVTSLVTWEWTLRDGVAVHAARVAEDGDSRVLLRPEDGHEPLEVQAVVVEVWRPSYDRTTHEATPELVARHVVPVRGGSR